MGISIKVLCSTASSSINSWVTKPKPDWNLPTKVSTSLFGMGLLGFVIYPFKHLTSENIGTALFACSSTLSCIGVLSSGEELSPLHLLTLTPTIFNLVVVVNEWRIEQDAESKRAVFREKIKEIETERLER